MNILIYYSENAESKCDYTYTQPDYVFEQSKSDHIRSNLFNPFIVFMYFLLHSNSQTVLNPGETVNLTIETTYGDRPKVYSYHLPVVTLVDAKGTGL